MKCHLIEQIDHEKPIAFIGRSKENIMQLIDESGISNQIGCLQTWDFEKKAICYYQISKQAPILIHLNEKNSKARPCLNALLVILQRANEEQLTELQIVFETFSEDSNILLQIVKTVLLTDYSFSKYKEKKTEFVLQKVSLLVKKVTDKEDQILTESSNLTKAIALARDLVNEPSNVIYPRTLAEKAMEIAQEADIQCTILEENEIQAQKMEAFLSVAKGSKNPPRLIVLTYSGNPENPTEILGLVGKGLTYDSGGYSIKSTEGMFTMKADMAGSAAVIGAIYAIAKQKLKCNVTAVVAACENLISGGAYKPGEVISSMSGKTIEIGNTDAEGRLTLVDAIYYAIEQENVSKVIDVATLTGAVVVGLGNVRTGVLANNDDFFADLEKAAENSGERFWRLPHDDDYKELLKSEIADISNTGGRMAGTITAGLFIKHFLPKEIPWLHLDIAGTAYQSKKSSNSLFGATGVPVSTLYFLAKRFCD
jgi:leucyl aminopeptidase